MLCAPKYRPAIYGIRSDSPPLESPANTAAIRTIIEVGEYANMARFPAASVKASNATILAVAQSNRYPNEIRPIKKATPESD